MDDFPGSRCPACGATGASGAGFCSWCGLNLTGPEADGLYALVARLEALDRELIACSDRREAVATELTQRRWALNLAPTSAGAVAIPATAAPWERPRREWSVERVRDALLWLGAALLALSALTFTAVAWSHLDDNGRAALLGATTLVVTGFAAALRRRMPATADAFAGLAITVALIDWYALRRAGVGAGMSGAAWWAAGTALVAVFAFALARNGATKPARIAVGVLAPVSALLVIDTFTGAAWSASMALSVLAAGLIVVTLLVKHDGRASSAIVTLLATESALIWLVAVGTALVAISVGSLAPAVTSGAVVVLLGLAPAFVVVRAHDLDPTLRAVHAALAWGAVLGAILTVSSAGLGPQGLLVLSAALGTAMLAVAPLLTEPVARRLDDDGVACTRGGSCLDRRVRGRGRRRSVGVDSVRVEGAAREHRRFRRRRPPIIGRLHVHVANGRRGVHRRHRGGGRRVPVRTAASFATAARAADRDRYRHRRRGTHSTRGGRVRCWSCG